MSQKTLHQQTGKFVASIAENLPNLSVQEMQFFINNPKELERRLYESLVPKSRQNITAPLLISKRHLLIIDDCNGEQILKDANDVFDDNGAAKIFELFETSTFTEAISAEVYGVPEKKALTYEQVFHSLSEDLDTLCLTQHQIIIFCKKYKSWLSKEDGVTNFLIKEKNIYMVVYVYIGSLGQLNLDITELNYDHKTPSIKKKCRVIIPQQFF